MTLLDPDGLRAASGQVFYNTSKFTLKSLLGNSSQLEANFNYYLDGFSPNVAEIIAKLDLRNQIWKIGGIDAYFEKEVRPHVEVAWIDASKTVIGYEISFNKYFYVHQPLRDLEKVVQEIRGLEKETEGLLEKILDFGTN